MDIKRLAQSKEKNIFTGVHMTVASLFSDMILIGVFMLAGFFVREIVKPIQKLFLPASLIGGLLALILGQQMLGLVEIPESFSKFSNVLIAPIMAALLFGVTINKKKVVGYMDYICVEQGIYGMQMAVGAALGALLAVLWPGLPKGWGTMGVFAFQGGHGNAGAAGQTYENLGIPENLSVGMVLATFGLIMAMLVGMVVVNIGVRKGWTKFVKDAQKQPDWYYGGVLPEEKRSSIGSTVTSSIGINHLALQGGWLLAAVYAGRLLIKAVGLVWPGVSVLPTVIQGILGGAIIWNLAKAVKLDRYIDVKTIKHVSGFLLEVVVLTAIILLIPGKLFYLHFPAHRRILRFRQRLNDIFHNHPRHILSRRRQLPIRQKLKLLFLQAVSRKKQPTRFFRILKRLAAHPISKFFNYIHCSFFHSFKFIFLSYRPDADGYGSAPLQENGHSLL